MTREGWRPIRLATIARAELAGSIRLSDPPRGLRARALRSPRGAIYQLRMMPLATRRFEERRFADAA